MKISAFGRSFGSDPTPEQLAVREQREAEKAQERRARAKRPPSRALVLAGVLLHALGVTAICIGVAMLCGGLGGFAFYKLVAQNLQNAGYLTVFAVVVYGACGGALTWAVKG